MTNVDSTIKLVRAATALVVVIVIGVAFGLFRACAPQAKKAEIPSCGTLPIGERVESACNGQDAKKIQVCTARGLETVTECPVPDGDGDDDDDAPRAFVDFAATESLALGDATNPKFDADDQKKLRWLALTHKYNEGADIVEAERAANKTMLSVSTERDIFKAVPVPGSNGTLLQIDIGELGIDSKDWDLIEANLSEPIISKTAKGRVLQQLTGTEVPIVLFDDFADTVFKAPVYHALTNVPATINQFFQQIGVNFAGDLAAREDVQFACFPGSAISASNGTRLVVRFESDDGWMYITFDPLALNGNATRSCQVNPLLAQTGSQRLFNFAASEILYTLPNGAIGSALFDAQGKRQDAAPLNIVADNVAPVGVGPEIKNGISCVRCHSAGILPFADQVRDSLRQNAFGFNAADQQRILELYPPKAEMDRIIADDRADFADRMRQIGIESVDVDPINEFRDPMLLNQDCARAAARFWLTCDELKTAIQQDVVVAAKLGSLLSGGTVTRDVLIDARNQLIAAGRIFEDPI